MIMTKDADKNSKNNFRTEILLMTVFTAKTKKYLQENNVEEWLVALNIVSYSYLVLTDIKFLT